MNECKCGKEGTEELHTCPFAVEIGCDEETLCNCCEFCESCCADEI